MNPLLSSRLRKSAAIIRQNDRLDRLKMEVELLRLVTAAQAVAPGRPSPSRPSPSRPSGQGGSSSQRRDKDPDRERKVNALVEFGDKNSKTIVKHVRDDFNTYIHRSVVRAAQSMGEVFNDDRSPLMDAFEEPLAAIVGALREDGRVDRKALSAAQSKSLKYMHKLDALKRFTGNVSEAPAMYRAVLSLATGLQQAQDPKLIGMAKISERGMDNYNKVVLGVLRKLKKVRELKSSLDSAKPDQRVVDEERKKLGAGESTEESTLKVKELKDEAAKLAATAEEDLSKKAKELYKNNNPKLLEMIDGHIKEAYSPDDSMKKKKLLRRSTYETFFYMTRMPQLQNERGTGILHASSLLEAHEGKKIHDAYRLYLLIARTAEYLGYALSRWSSLPSDKREEQTRKMEGLVNKSKGRLDKVTALLSGLTEDAAPLELSQKKEKEEAQGKEEETQGKEEELQGKEKPALRDPDIPQDTPMPEGESKTRAVEAIKKQMDAIEADVQKQLDPMVEFMVGEASNAYRNANPDKKFDLKEVIKENIDEFYSGGVVDTAINSSDKGEYVNARKMKNTMEDFDINELDDDKIGRTIIRMYRVITISARILGILQYLGNKPEVILTSSWAQDKIKQASKRLNVEHRRFQALKRTLVTIRPATNKIKDKSVGREASVKK